MLPLAAEVFVADPREFSCDDAVVFAGWVTDNQHDDDAELLATLSVFYEAIVASAAACDKFVELMEEIGGAKLFLHLLELDSATLRHHGLRYISLF